MKEPTLVILAAGMGSRYGGLKQIDPMDEYGNAIIDYSIYDAKRAGFQKIVFLIKEQIADVFKNTIGKRVEPHIDVAYAYQEIDNLPEGYQPPEGREKPWGTAHAIYCCKDVVNGPFAVINADDYYGVDAYKVMYDYLTKEHGDDKYHYAMVGYQLQNTVTDNGHVSRGICVTDENHYLKSITERTHIEKREKTAVYTEDDGETWMPIAYDTLVSMNFFGFQHNLFDEISAGFPAFLDDALANNPLKGEYFIPSVVSHLIDTEKADVKVLSSTAKWYGVTYKEDKDYVVKALKAFREEGIYPDSLWG
ncbi:MAG: sugar phosphate nucleotidyltransferase [Anaerostipes sp.]|nr:sugar phosphate nucleotidyltransferase [Anaerostipes sp.]